MKGNRTGVKLDDIRKIDRFREPPDEGKAGVCFVFKLHFVGS